MNFRLYMWTKMFRKIKTFTLLKKKMDFNIVVQTRLPQRSLRANEMFPEGDTSIKQETFPLNPSN